MPGIKGEEIEYNEYHYGKGSVKVAKIKRKPEGSVDSFKTFTVDIQLYGKLLIDSFRAPSNKLVVPTDTIKNTVYVLAKKYPMNNPVEFAIDVSDHFLHKYAHISKARVDIQEFVWRRIITSDNTEHTHGFVDKSSYRYRCSAVNDRAHGLTLDAGIVDLEILKTRGSAFEDFWTDEFTTLKPARDRIMSTKANIKWTFDSFYQLKSIDHNEIFSKVKQMFSEQFAKHDKSASVQHTIDVIGSHILHSIKELSTIDMNLPNVHYLLFNLEQFNMENNNEVFIPTTEPYGDIYAELAKTERAVKCLNEASDETARKVISDLIHSDKIVDMIISRRPFRNFKDLRSQFNAILLKLSNEEFLNSKSNLCCSRLGSDANKKKLAFIEEEFKLPIVDELDHLNEVYEKKFDHMFIVSVTGMSIEEIIGSIKQRILNEPTEELNICIGEMKKIMNIRVETVLNSFARSLDCVEEKHDVFNNNNKLNEATVAAAIISSHILDLNSGKPAEGVKAQLYKKDSLTSQWLLISDSYTNKDGRISNLLNNEALQVGLYKVVFFTGEYFAKKKLEAFYPEVEVKFQINDKSQKYHIPLLLNQYGFSTYRGS